MIDDDDDWDDGDDDESDDMQTECPHCGESIFDDAEQCPYCRMYLSSSDFSRFGGQTKTKMAYLAIALMIIATFVLALFSRAW